MRPNTPDTRTGRFLTQSALRHGGTMKWINLFVTLGAVLLVVVLSTLQPPRDAAPAYNAANEIKAASVVEDVSEFFCPVSDDQGLHLWLKTSAGKVLIHVGPARCLRTQEIRFSAG